MKKQSPKLKMGQYDENHYYKLCEGSNEKCEFCDYNFQNRYRCLIHTAKHIIIPLIKHEIFQCYYCMFCFTSKEDLTSHKKSKHTANYLNEMMEQVVTNTIAIKCEKIDFSPIKDYKNVCEEDNLKDTNTYKEEVSVSDIEKAAANADNLIMKKLNEFRNEVRKLSICNPTEVNAKLAFKPQTHLQKLLMKPQKPMSYLQETFLNGVTITPVKRNKDILPTNKIKTPLINHQMILNNYNNTDEEFILPDISPITNVPDLNDRTEINTIEITDDTEAPSVKYEPIFETYQPQQPKLSTRIAPYNDLTLTNGAIQKPESLQMQTEERLPSSKFMNIRYNDYARSVPPQSKITIINGVIKKPETTIETEKRMPTSKFVSVHYDDLVKPGMFRCKKCGLTFPNKFDVVTHETAAHFGFKRKKYLGAMHCAFCDWYIAGNYRSLDNHIASKHKNTKISRHQQTCDKCKLKYTNKIRHDHIYHHIPINITAPVMPKVKKIRKIDECLLCDVCSMFLKNNKCGKFTTEGVLQEYGKKYNCSNCNSIVDAVEMFKIFKYSYVDNNQQLPDEQGTMRDTKMTNEVRLKNIQRRLIKMKK